MIDVGLPCTCAPSIYGKRREGSAASRWFRVVLSHTVPARKRACVVFLAHCKAPWACALIIFFDKWKKRVHAHPSIKERRGSRMASDKQFSHITVNAAEEDDVVIQAGSPMQPVDEPAMPCGAPVSQDDAAPADAPVAAAPEGAPAAPEPEAEVFEAPAESASEGVDSRNADEAGAPADAAAWREQTLEDLEAGPMSKMQKIVLGAAAVFVVVALVWYFCFMR